MKRRMSSQNSGVGGNPSDCDIMASGSPGATGAGDSSEAAEECSGKKKSKFQTFKNFFVKKKRKESPPLIGEVVLKASQSSDDVTEEPRLVQRVTHDELGSMMNMGSKAMSHDSVFMLESPSSENNNALRTSQDSIYGKLQLNQAIRLGSPPAFICRRKTEDAGAFSDDDGLPCSPPEYSSINNIMATPPHKVADLTQRSSYLSMEGSDSDDQMSYESFSRSSTPQDSVPADFCMPASSISCLDSTAARHRIAVKAKAFTRGKPVSREMLQIKRKDLREKLLLREMEDKLWMVTSIVEEETEDLPMIQDLERKQSMIISIPSEHMDEDLTDSLKSATSAGDFSEVWEHDSAGNYVHKSEVLDSPWENPEMLLLQADDFLLITGCEDVPDEQGSLLEEVLSSLKSPLVSRLAMEHENMALQSEVADINNGSAVDQQKVNKDFLRPLSSTAVKVPQPITISVSTVDSFEIKEEILKKEATLEGPKLVSVSQVHVEKELNKTGNAKEKHEKTEFEENFFEKIDTAETPALNVKVNERVEIIAEDNDELESETEPEKVEGKISGLMFMKLENIAEKPEDNNREATSSRTHKDETFADINLDIIIVSDQTVRDNALNSSKQAEISRLPQAEIISPAVTLEATILHSTFMSVCPLEKEDKPEPSNPQEASSKKLEGVSEMKEIPESSVEQQITSAEVRPRFTIAPAWQRSLASGVSREQISGFTKTCNEPPQTPELHTPVKKEQSSSKPARTQSSPARIYNSPTRVQSSSPVEEEFTLDNPFGVRLRRTAVIRGYDVDGDSSSTQKSQTASESPEMPDIEQHESKTIRPKKSDLIETVMSVRKIPDPVGRISGGDTESPSWISVARQKQRNFIENSPEAFVEKQEDFTMHGLSNSITQEQLAQPCSTIKGPLVQDEPPWMALAKKKAKAWSEMPQIVQ